MFGLFHSVVQKIVKILLELTKEYSSESDSIFLQKWLFLFSTKD